jgi:hypothetical protein
MSAEPRVTVNGKQIGNWVGYPHGDDFGRVGDLLLDILAGFLGWIAWPVRLSTLPIAPGAAIGSDLLAVCRPAEVEQDASADDEADVHYPARFSKWQPDGQIERKHEDQ